MKRHAEASDGSTGFAPSVDGLFDSRRAWLSIAIGAGLLVYLSYLITHRHPAYEGGLFLQIVAEIRTGDSLYPSRIPYYTADGVPFAYPPLVFFATARFVDVTGVDPVFLSLYLPGAVVIASLVPYYFVARDLLYSEFEAGLATTLFAVAPPVLKWHISAGGLVRAPATFLTLAGIYVGLRLFRTGDRRWLLPATVLFGLVVLAHPVYPVFVGLSYLLLFAALDRSRRGLVDGAVVATGGVLLAAPWWLTVGVTHGFDVFLGAASTRTTIGGGSSRFVRAFVYPFTGTDAITPFYVAAFAGGGYALLERRYLLPIWMVSAGYLLGEQRFTFVAGAMLAAVFVVEVLVPVFTTVATTETSRRLLSLGLVFAVVLASTGVGVAFAGSRLETTHGSSTTLPQTVDPADRAAMAWVRTHTSPTAEFVVLGDAAEWFPYYADRTILVSPWGTEWTSPDRFHEHVELYTALSSCRTARCLDRSLGSVEGDPEFLYIPTDEFTVRGKEHRRSFPMEWSVHRSERYVPVFENRGVLIVRVRDAGERDAPPREMERISSVASRVAAGRSPSTRRPTAVPRNPLTKTFVSGNRTGARSDRNPRRHGLGRGRQQRAL